MSWDDLTAPDRAFVLRCLRREVKRTQRKLDPTFVPAPGKRNAQVSRLEHLDHIITALEDDAPLCDCYRCTGIPPREDDAPDEVPAHEG